MIRYAIVYTLAAGRERRHILEAWITDVPTDLKGPDVSQVLAESRHSADYSERGVWLGNRRLLTEAQLPKALETPADVRTIPWGEVAAASSQLVQLNVRVTAGERAAMQLAAKRAGLSFKDWAVSALRERAGI